jgi:hypothetical protein
LPRDSVRASRLDSARVAKGPGHDGPRPGPPRLPGTLGGHLQTRPPDNAKPWLFVLSKNPGIILSFIERAACGVSLDMSVTAWPRRLAPPVTPPRASPMAEVRGLASLTGLSFDASPKPENAFLGAVGPRASRLGMRRRGDQPN